MTMEKIDLNSPEGPNGVAVNVDVLKSERPFRYVSLPRSSRAYWPLERGSYQITASARPSSGRTGYFSRP